MAYLKLRLKHADNPTNASLYENFNAPLPADRVSPDTIPTLIFLFSAANFSFYTILLFPTLILTLDLVFPHQPSFASSGSLKAFS